METRKLFTRKDTVSISGLDAKALTLKHLKYNIVIKNDVMISVTI